MKICNEWWTIRRQVQVESFIGRPELLAHLRAYEPLGVVGCFGHEALVELGRVNLPGVKNGLDHPQMAETMVMEDVRSVLRRRYRAAQCACHGRVCLGEHC